MAQAGCDKVLFGMVLGVIPARGGSKGIPRKNIRPLLGRPLIEWTIQAATEAELLDRFIVSTEDREIAEISRRAGAEVLERPPELAEDDTTTVAVLQHVASQLNPDTIVLLQPTSPVRPDGLIDRAIRQFQSSDYDTLATGIISHCLQWGATENVPRQALQGYFHDDGNIYVFSRAIIEAGRWFGDRVCRMEVESCCSFEIDLIADFWANEGILRHVRDGDLKSWTHDEGERR